MTNDTSKAASILGQLGGRAGRGKAKARTKEQAQRAAKTRWAKQKLRTPSSTVKLPAG